MMNRETLPKTICFLCSSVPVNTMESGSMPPYTSTVVCCLQDNGLTHTVEALIMDPPNSQPPLYNVDVPTAIPVDDAMHFLLPNSGKPPNSE